MQPSQADPIHTDASSAFKYLVPRDSSACDIRSIGSGDVRRRTIQCAGLLCVACCGITIPLFILSGLGFVHNQAEPEPSAGIPVKTLSNVTRELSLGICN